MDLTTRYLGLTLPHPIVPSAAQPLTKDLDHLKQLEDGGAAAVVIHSLFEELEVSHDLTLSTSQELLLPLRWIAIIRGQVNMTLSATTGAHTPEDALKLILAGADIVNMCSALLKHGPEHLGVVRDGISRWLEAHEYDSLAQARGSMSQASCPEPAAFERANYMKVVHGYGEA